MHIAFSRPVLTVFCLLLCAAAFAVLAELGFSRSLTPGLIAFREKQFGGGARTRLEGWKAFVREAAAARQPGEDRLRRPVCRFFSRIPSLTDIGHWGVDDYWATPSETLASNGA